MSYILFLVSIWWLLVFHGLNNLVMLLLHFLTNDMNWSRLYSNSVLYLFSDRCVLSYPHCEMAVVV